MYSQNKFRVYSTVASCIVRDPWTNFSDDGGGGHLVDAAGAVAAENPGNYFRISNFKYCSRVNDLAPTCSIPSLPTRAPRSS